ncbi:MAG: hypothetical protein HYX57_00200 [Chloroflexi bacterium]|nr:hypothetical protein [Chloroflexota bacterium]
MQAISPSNRVLGANAGPERVNRPTFVFDVDIPPFLANRVFDAEHARQYPGAEAFAALGAVLRKEGLETVTADLFLAGSERNRPAICLSNELTRFTDELLSLESVIPVACMSLESPIVAIDFYKRLREVAERFSHVFLWAGMRDMAVGHATFHEISWPYPETHFWTPTTERPWSERGFLVLINSNKRIFVPPSRMVRPRHPRQTARNLIAAGRLSRLRRSERWLASELYKDRLDAIRHFSHSPDFDLYGRGWADSSTLSRPETEAVARSYRGELPALAKISVLANYKFALCFENTAFPGYVTEKIFDCFQAGCIPIYLGAPDITSLVPSDAFIDARDFRDGHALEAFIRSIAPDAAERYRVAATRFIGSGDAERFTQGHFVTEMSATLLERAGSMT